MPFKLVAVMVLLLISYGVIHFVNRHAASSRPAPVTSQSALNALTGSSPVKPETQWVTLKVPVSKPVFAGTPRFFKLTDDMHLDPKERALYPNGRVLASSCMMGSGELRVPKGTELISIGKPVTMSDNDPVIGEASDITDGSIEFSLGNWVELPGGLQWVQVDLGEQNEIWGICMWHDYWPRSIYRDVIVMTADDAAFTKNVRTLFNNDQDNSAKMGIGKDFEYVESGDGKMIQANNIRARYVRCYSGGNTSDAYNRWVEICIFGQRTSDAGR